MKFRLPHVTRPWRDWKIEEQGRLANFSDFAFRVTEMILVCGVVAYLEQTLGWGKILSSALSGLTAVYVRGKATVALLSDLHGHKMTEERTVFLYWVVIALSIGLFGGIIGLNSWLVPLIASNHGL